jgi:hypothetical protein
MDYFSLAESGRASSTNVAANAKSESSIHCEKGAVEITTSDSFATVPVVCAASEEVPKVCSSKAGLVRLPESRDDVKSSGQFQCEQCLKK